MTDERHSCPDCDGQEWPRAFAHARFHIAECKRSAAEAERSAGRILLVLKVAAVLMSFTLGFAVLSLIAGLAS